MLKKTMRVVALMLVLAFALTGCSLIEVDQAMDDAEVVIKVNDTEILKKDVMETYDYFYNQNYYYWYMYNSYGLSYQMPDEDTMKQQVIDALVLNEVRKQKAAELGLDQLSEEELAQVNTDAQAAYDADFASVKEQLTEDGMTEEEITAAAEKYFADNGITMDAYVESATTTLISEKLDADTIKDITVSDDAVKATFDSYVTADKDSCAEGDTSAINSKLMYGDTVYYYPAGFRSVKHILVKFTDEDNAAVTSLKSQIADIESQIEDLSAEPAEEEPAAEGEEPAEDAEPAEGEETAEEPVDTEALLADLNTQLTDLQAQLATAEQTRRDNVMEKVESAHERAVAGEDFDALCTELSDDTVPGAEYILNADTTAYVTEFQEGAMALAAKGDISEPIESTYGYHIILYYDDIPEGEVEYTDEIKTDIFNGMLTEAQNAEISAKNDEWVKAAKVETHIERMVSYAK